MLYNGTCLARTCDFSENNTNVVLQSLNPNHLLETIVGLPAINCTIHDDQWEPYLEENSIMPSDEFFQ